MPRFVLRLTRPETITSEEAKSSFYWLNAGDSGFTTSLDPNLVSLGSVSALNVDFVRIAATVYAADRSTRRAGRGSNWSQRSIDLEVPVSDAVRWASVAGDLGSLLGFLTGDRWSLSFNEDNIEAKPSNVEVTKPKRVVLVSGGADSAIGALVSRSELTDGESHTLVSHLSPTTIGPFQREVADGVIRLLPGPAQHHEQIRFWRRETQIDGARYAFEPSSRSRSILFLALGLAVASIHGAPLWIPENGFASLNPPLGPNRRGSLSTRTTHPAFLGGLTAVLTAAGAHREIINPFAAKTKAELFSQAAALIGAAEASGFLSGTHSCAHTGQRSFRISTTAPCGVCFGCVVRRAGFSASGMTDTTAYINAGNNRQLQHWLDSVSVLPALQGFVRRGVNRRDLIALSLPPGDPLDDALDLCARAIAELAELLP
jgi:hypothetical protein